MLTLYLPTTKILILLSSLPILRSLSGHVFISTIRYRFAIKDYPMLMLIRNLLATAISLTVLVLAIQTIMAG